MRSVRASTNGPAAQGLAELNHHMLDELKEVRDVVTGGGHGLSEEDESRINCTAEDVNGGHIDVIQAHAVPQRQQQQPQGPVVQWERFLPLRSLKVLLVENDDCTRHVVSALLRNCSYEVLAVANGLEAWKTLEDLTNHVDLVLTEVVMPCLSGVGLLAKIKSHKTCKNIPVIMMSSNDSMGIVFKCLSKGAVDFLVKPIRKNELKTLWQHVWRKCQSSSGSGSESGIWTHKSTRSKNIEGSENNTGSNNEDDNGNVILNAKDGSDNGSGTQSSWSKRAVEVESPQPVLPWNQLVDPPDSTCAQVIHSRPEAFSNNWLPSPAIRECDGEDDELENVAMGKGLEIGTPRISGLHLEDPSKKVLKSVAETNEEKACDMDSKKGGEKLVKGILELHGETVNVEVRNKIADLMGAIANSSNSKMQTAAYEVPNELSMIAKINDKVIIENKELPYLELSLKRQRDVGDPGTTGQERKVLRHSGLSAFSRYNTSSNANQAPTGDVGSCSPVDNNSSEAAKTESMPNLQVISNGNPNQRSNGSSNDDMGSTTNNAFSKPEAFSDKPMPRSTVNVHPCSAFQPVQHGHTVKGGKADGAAANSVLAQANAMHQQVQVQHHHHHHHYHHHHLHNVKKQPQKLPHQDDLSLKNMVSQCGPSNVLTAPTEGNTPNYSLNGSASGSNNRSNGENGSSGQNGSSTAAIAEGTNMASVNGVAGICGPEDGSGSGSRSGVDQNRSAHREAALNKFRQKRKDRCFEKKVRYHSRKKLAEQRPRVRGQFVRQALNESKTRTANS
ncbi:hypothetical protein RJ639_043460 [Escallonia herrerae]|uniref:Two-component response regulator-like PRR37 n=1 Tax=Escallonia herrerae TaxID=1293975 RepID=A0AA88WBP7_9ASTE|nr:hypothetical protein RJ639_043460 [Escallonia herrerae]